MKSYVIHRSSVLKNGMPGEEKGYSLFFYNISKPSYYCILNKENKYEIMSQILGSAIGLLLAFITFGSAPTFYMTFNKFHAIMKPPDNNIPDNNIRYFVWSIATTCCLVSVLIICYDVHTFAENIYNYPASPHSQISYLHHIFVLFVLTLVC